MFSPDTRTAVLLFALPDAVETDRKHVTRRGTVWRAMRALTRTKIRATGLPLLESNRLIDHRGTFGEQLGAAVSAVLARGYDRVICLGNDCPDVSVTDLKRSVNALTAGQLPMGADRRGGVYLVSFDRAQFDADALTQLPWQTNQLADALRDYFTARGTVPTELPVRTDVNHRVDALAVRWLGQVASRLLMTVRQALLPVEVPPVSFVPIGTFVVTPARQSGRAPPCCG